MCLGKSKQYKYRNLKSCILSIAETTLKQQKLVIAGELPLVTFTFPLCFDDRKVFFYGLISIHCLPPPKKKKKIVTKEFQNQKKFCKFLLERWNGERPIMSVWLSGPHNLSYSYVFITIKNIFSNWDTLHLSLSN